MAPTFEYFMNRAMALESNVEHYHREMLLDFLNSKPAIKLSKEHGYNYYNCKKILLETAKGLLDKRDMERGTRILLYVPNIRSFKEDLLKKLN